MVEASEQLAPSRSRITLEPKEKALRVTCWGPKPGHLKTHQCLLGVRLAAGWQKAAARRQVAWEQREGWRAAGSWATARGFITADGWRALDDEHSILIDLCFCS